MNNKGITLIEVVISLAILSIVLISYITLFGNVVIMTSESEDITMDTFALQEKMENKILEEKEAFVAGELEDYTVDVFSGEYSSTVPVKEIEEVHINDRRYVTLVSNIESEEPLPPDIKSFEVGAFLKSDTNMSTHVFPWYEDNIMLGAKYEFGPDPTIFENIYNWYRSQENFINPVFDSDYEKVDDDIIDELPKSNEVLYSDIDKNDYLLNNKYYYFKMQPYTLAGRVAIERNEDRILVLNKPTSNTFKEFLEGFYKKTDAGDTKVFDRVEEVYPEVMQNPEKATFDLGWSKNEDPKDALVGVKLSPLIITDDYKISLTFQVDSDTLNHEDLTLLGNGVYLGNANNTGNMITFDVFNNKVLINKVYDGDYVETVDEIDLLTASEFSDFLETIDGELTFDWTKEFTINLEYLNADEKIEFNLTYVDEDDNIVSSDTISFDSYDGINPPSYFGLKTYSNLDYIVDPLGIMYNKYERNYSTRYYNLTLPSEPLQGEFLTPHMLYLTSDDLSFISLDINDYSLNGDLEIDSFEIDERNPNGVFVYLVKKSTNLDVYETGVNNNTYTDGSEISNFNIEGTNDYLPVTDDLVLHLDASLINKTLDTDIDFWRDLSLNNNNAEDGDTNRRPLLKDGYLDFNQDYLEINHNSTINLNDLTVIAVYKTTMTGGWFRSIISKYGLSSITESWGLGWIDPNQLGFYARDNNGNINELNATNGVGLTGDLVYSMGILDKNNVDYRINGSSVGSENRNSNNIRNSRDIIIGWHGGDTSQFVDMDLYEIILYDGALDTDEINAVESYIESKYN